MSDSVPGDGVPPDGDEEPKQTPRTPEPRTPEDLQRDLQDFLQSHLGVQLPSFLRPNAGDAASGGAPKAKDEEKKKPRTPEELQRDLQEFLQKRLGVQIQTFLRPNADEPAATGGGAGSEGGAGDAGEDDEKRKLDALRFDLTPAQVKVHLDRYVIGQDAAKRALAVAVCDHYQHIRRVRSEAAGAIDYVKQNVILLGPTGVGKTYLIRTLAQLIGVPFVKADITKFSETGYVGGDVDDLVRELVRMADGDVELVEYGIIFLDEIDKIAASSNIMGRDVSGRGVQTGLLKLLEETEVATRSPNDISAQFQEIFGRSRRARRTINTRHILFVVSGAFSGLDEIIEKRLSAQSVGFAAAGADHRRQPGTNVLAKVATSDFVEYGFEPEFIGRLPIRVALDDLTRVDLRHILESSEGSILKQYRESFLGYGIDVAFSDAALDAIAERAIEEKTGARGLMTILESSLREFKFHLPGTEIRHLVIDGDAIDDPAAALEALLAEPAAARRAYAVAEVRRFEKEFAAAHGVRLVLDDGALEMAIGLSKELDLSIRAYLEHAIGGHAEFFRQLKQRSGKESLRVTPQILHRPGDAVDVWL